MSKRNQLWFLEMCKNVIVFANFLKFFFANYKIENNQTKSRSSEETEKRLKKDTKEKKYDLFLLKFFFKFNFFLSFC